MGRNEGEGGKHLPQRDDKSDEEGEEARKELDEIPAPGTDPLHEGP